MVYGRFTKERQSVVVINNNDGEVTKEISVWELGIPQECTMKSLMVTGEKGYDTTPVEYPVEGGHIRITMPKTSAIVLQHVYEEKIELETKKVQKNFLQF